jgi:uncharacterized protein
MDSISPRDASSFVPIQDFIFKVTSRCNLNCAYCYMYNKGDLSYLQQPKVMPVAVVDAAIERIRAYSSASGTRRVSIILHGGEPLLAGQTFFRRFVEKANSELMPDVQPVFNMQTNGTLLDQSWLDLLRELDIRFGISLDGPESINDANRVDHRGRGSYARVRRAIDLVLADSRVDDLFGGVLSVINLDADPLEIYDLYRCLGIRSADFLLPDGNYYNPPAGLIAGSTDTPYADWLIRLFIKWFSDDDPTLRIRIFEDIIGLIFGLPIGMDDLGGGGNGAIVIESDGTIEPVDFLKVCGDRFTKTDLNVADSDIADAYQSELIRISLADGSMLCKKCQQCPVKAVCGGGYLPHRYSVVNGFDNPSVYCHNLMRLIIYIQQKVVDALPVTLRHKLNIGPLVSNVNRQA